MYKLLLTLLLVLGNQTLLTAQCTAHAGADTSICLGASAQIGGLPAATGAGAPFNYTWTPATGLSCTNCPNPVVTPTANTTYTLTVDGSGGCNDTDVINVTIDPVPTANFSFATNNACSNIPFVFTNTSTGSGLTYSWNFGDPASGGSNTSTLANPTHLFQTFGTGTQSFTVTLVVTNAAGCTASTNQTITVTRAPDPLLIDVNNSFKNCGGGNFDMQVFDGTATGAISNYTIQWGDGSPDFSSGSFPGGGVNHMYSTSDVFTLNYILTGTNGCVDTSTYNIANITNPSIGSANPGGTTGCGPITLCFPLNNFSANHSTTYYEVNFGDGSPIVTLPHPPPATICHTYSTTSCGQAGNQFVFRIKAVNLCDSSSASISPIRIYTSGQANFNPAAQNNCVNSTVTFINSTVAGFNSACSASSLYQWNFGNGQTLTTPLLTNPTTTYSLPGTYTVTLTVTNSCGSSTITRTVCIENPPVPSFTLSPTTGCAPFVTTVTNTSDTSNTCAVTRLWTVLFNGSTCLPSAGTFSFVGGTNANSLNPQIQFSSPGNYTVRLTLTNACGSFIANQNVVVQGPPQVTLNPLATICAGNSVNPTAVVNDCLEPSDTYAWTFPTATPASASTLVPGSVTFPNAGTFTVGFSATNLCGTTSATTPITINPLPPNLNPSVNSPLCVGDQALFTSNLVAGVTYSWSGPNGFNSGLQNPTINPVSLVNSGTYTLFGTLNGCVGPSSSVNLTVNPIPIVSIVPPSASICLGDSISLTASGASSYSWTPIASLNQSTGSTVVATPSSTTTYTVVGTNASCSGNASSTITVNPLPVVSAGPDQTFCNQAIPVQLNGTPVGGTWSGAVGLTSTGSFTPSAVGTFQAIYSFTNVNGCTNHDTLILTVIAPTFANAGPDISACLNSPAINLGGTPIGGTWSGTNTSVTGVFSPTLAGTFNSVYTLGTGTCLTRDTVQITVFPLPIVDAGLPQSYCISDVNDTLIGSPLLGSWSGNGIIHPSGIFSPNSAGAGAHSLVYSFTDSNSCTFTDNVIITVNPLPIVSAGSDLILCNQPIPTNMTGTPVGGSWTGPNITPTGVFTPAGNGINTLVYTFTNANGCTNTDTVLVTVISPTQPNAGPDFSLCIDVPNVTLTPTPTGGTWSGANVTPAGIFNPTLAGNVSLVYSFGTGTCLLTDTLIVTVNPLPIVDAGLPATYCISEPNFVLTGSPLGGTWTGTGITNPSGNFSPSTAGAGNHTLTYSFTDANSCTSTDNVVITINALPIVNAGPDLTLCNQPIPVNIVGSPVGGSWSGPNVTPTGVFIPAGNGINTLVYSFTNANGCTNTDTVLVTVISPTQPDAGPDFALCIDAPNVTLTPTPTGGTWSGANVTPAGIFNPAVVGNVSLVYSFGTGTCLLTDTLVVTVNPLPIVDAGLPATYCISEPNFVLTASPLGGTWTGTGITNPSGNFSPSTAGAGNHTLTYSFTDVNSCTSTDNVVITINALPIVNAGPDSTVCNLPISVQLAASPSGGSWTGTNVSPSGVFTPSAVGSFTLTYTFTNGNGCTNSDTRIVTVVSPVISNAGPDLVVCIDAANVTLAGTPASGSWSGSFVTPAGIFDPTIAGTFPLVISNGVGNCLTRDTMLFTVNPLPIVSVGSDQVFCPNDAPVNFVGSPLGGTWSGTGISNTTTGFFEPSIPAPGVYPEIYTFTSPTTGCINRDTLLATVNSIPVANFTYNPITCIGTSELFTNTTVNGSSYEWDFGDLNTSIATSPNHTYTSAGFFNIELIASTPQGCKDTLIQSIEVRVPPVANFSLAPDSACGPVIVSFTDLSTGPSLSYNWNFGNGANSTLPNPGNQTYVASLVSDTLYIVTLNVTNFCGTSQHQDTVIAMPQPVALFGTDFGIGCTPLNLQFVNNSVGLPDSYLWDFGDGTFSTDTSATLQHVFYTGTEDTTYTILLTVQNECGTDTISHQVTVIPPQVNAFFNTDDPDGCVPHTVNFTQFTQGAIFSSWDFGDGNTSTVYNPTHTFTNPGTYTVRLFANGCGFDTAEVVITVFPSPLVSFDTNPDSVCINEIFAFTNTSPTLAGSHWDFGDGDTSILTSPTHIFQTSGTYQVTLTGTSLLNGCTASVTHPIIVSTNPVADFSLTPTSGCVPLTVTMTNLSSNSSFYAWDFGDGNTSTTISPTHTFTTPGTYAITLYAENANGCTDTIFKTVTVHPFPAANFSVNSNDVCSTPMISTFTNSSTGGTNYEWNFGDGQTSTLTNPVHTYNSPGNYTVSLIVTTIYGCKDTAEILVSNFVGPTVSFTMPTDTICQFDELQFVATSTLASSLQWNFGDGNIVTGNPASYTYTQSGIFPVELIAFGAGGCSDTANSNVPIVIMPTPTADFSYENVQNSNLLSGLVEFTNLSSGATTYSWDFGNGNNSTETNPTEQYEQSGMFTIELIATSDYGCVDTSIQTLEVEFFYGLFIPNAMSPGHSDFGVANFIPKGVGMKNFELLIYDDWGNLIWSTNALDTDGRPTEYWDGTFNGEPVQQDAYVWKATATFLNEKVWEGKEYPNGKLKRSGTITIIR